MRTVRELRLAGLFAYLASLVIALLLSLGEKARHERPEGEEVGEDQESHTPVAQETERPSHAPPAFFPATCAPHMRGAISALLPWWMTKPASRITGGTAFPAFRSRSA